MTLQQLLSMLGLGTMGAIGDKQSAQDRQGVVDRATNRFTDMKALFDSTKAGTGQNPALATASTNMVNQLGSKFTLPSYTNPYANNPNFGQPDADVQGAYKQAVMRGSMLGANGTEAMGMAMQNLRNRTAVRPRIGG